MTPGTHIPVRSCMGCGERAPQRALLRVAVTPAGALELVRGRRVPPGRTGYLHDRPVCWRAFAGRKGRVRSLGRSVDRGVRLACVRELECGCASASTR